MWYVEDKTFVTIQFYVITVEEYRRLIICQKQIQIPISLPEDELQSIFSGMLMSNTFT